MKLTSFLFLGITSFNFMVTISCNTASEPNDVKKDTISVVSIKEIPVTYKSDTVTSNGYITYDENKKGKKPVVLIIPEWWGLGDYVRGRAKQLAEMGYVAMCVDMYGNGITAEDPKTAGELATPFYKNPQLTKIKIDAALQQLNSFADADVNNAVAIGYCFGGYSVLNAAKLGAALKGVVSFHGNLSGVSPDKDKLKASILVCHGASDGFVPETEVQSFKKSMDSIKADYTFIAYPNATHAFTNPGATEKGKKYNLPIQYNAAADSASWNDMKTFFAKVLHK